MALGKNVKRLREAKGMDQATLSRLSGVSVGSISALEVRDSVRSQFAAQLAKALGVTTDELMTEHATANITLPGITVTATGSNQALALMGRAGTAINLIDDIYPVEFSIPLLSWVRAGAFCEAPGQFTKDDAEELLPRPLFRTGPNTFALRVVGDSMDVPDGYREGEIVYVDPSVEPTPGKDVLAKTGDKMTLKRYKVDEDGPYLLQLNGNKIIRPTGDWSVCGVVVYAGRRC